MNNIEKYNELQYLDNNPNFSGLRNVYFMHGGKIIFHITPNSIRQKIKRIGNSILLGGETWFDIIKYKKLSLLHGVEIYLEVNYSKTLEYKIKRIEGTFTKKGLPKNPEEYTTVKIKNKKELIYYKEKWYNLLDWGEKYLRDRKLNEF